MPMPTSMRTQSNVGVDPNLPYPCQGGACGCDSAEKCWTACCCMSPDQRTAWAHSHQITPPAYAVLSEPATEVPLGCNQCKTESSSKKMDSSPKKTCCQTQSPTKPRGQLKFAIGLSAAKCQGKSFDLSQSFPFLASLPLYANIVVPSIAREAIALTSPSLVVLDVELPPPRWLAFAPLSLA